MWQFVENELLNKYIHSFKAEKKLRNNMKKSKMKPMLKNAVETKYFFVL